MIEWIPVIGSRRIIAQAYDPRIETIYVRFRNGEEWRYGDRSRRVWEEFSCSGQSRGQYIEKVLSFKPNGRHVG